MLSSSPAVHRTLLYSQQADGTERGKLLSPHGSTWVSGRDETNSTSKKPWNSRECGIQT